MAEALLNELGAGKFTACSTGARPAGEVHPLALATLRADGHATAGLYSKSWEEFAGPNSPVLDYIVTVCDSAAAEVCPAWPRRPATMHWDFADPAAVKGSDAVRRAAFADCYSQIRATIEALVRLPNAWLYRWARIASSQYRLGNEPSTC